MCYTFKYSKLRIIVSKVQMKNVTFCIVHFHLNEPILYKNKVFCIYSNSTLPLSRYCCHKAIPTNGKKGQQREGKGERKGIHQRIIFSLVKTYIHLVR